MVPAMVNDFKKRLLDDGCCIYYFCKAEIIKTSALQE
jgi:hypothetical protein